MTSDEFAAHYRATLDVMLNELQSITLLSQQTDLRIQAVANSVQQLTRIVEQYLQTQEDISSTQDSGE